METFTSRTSNFGLSTACNVMKENSSNNGTV